jgi:hypothetical protein
MTKKRVTQTSKKNKDFDPDKVGLAVATLAVVSLILLAVIATTA